MTATDDAALAAIGAVAAEQGVSAAPVAIKSAHNVVAVVGPVVARAATPLAQRVGRDSRWFRRELAIVEHLVAAAAPVVAPARVVDPGPHERDGFVIVFWERVAVDVPAPWDPVAVADTLVEVNRALAGFRGELPPFWPLEDFDDMLERVDLGAYEPLVVAARDHLCTVLAEERPPRRLVHGDAHVGNCLLTSEGPRWTDFEDACAAPVEWDAACIALAAEIGEAGPVARAVFERVYADAAPRILDAMLDFRAAIVAQWSAYVHGSTKRAGPRLAWLQRRLG